MTLCDPGVHKRRRKGGILIGLVLAQGLEISAPFAYGTDKMKYVAERTVVAIECLFSMGSFAFAGPSCENWIYK